MAVKTTIQHRRDTAANWTSTNSVLAAGEMGVETDTLKFKVGDGSTAWSSLKYSAGSYQKIASSGTAQTQRPTLNFVGATITDDATNNQTTVTISAGGGFTSITVSSNITLQKNYNYFVNTSAARTLSLPALPSLGDEIHVFDATGSAATNNITVTPNSSDYLMGSSQSLTIDVNYAGVVLIWTGSSYGWRVN